MTYTRGMVVCIALREMDMIRGAKSARQNGVSLTTPTLVALFTLLTIVANNDRIKSAIFCFTRASPAGSPNDHFAPRVAFQVANQTGYQ